MLWIQARHVSSLGWPAGAMVRLFLAASLMALCAYGIGVAIPGTRGLIAAILLGVPAYLMLVKLLHGLESEDFMRLSLIGRILPAALSRPYRAIIGFILSTGTGTLKSSVSSAPDVSTERY